MQSKITELEGQVRRSSNRALLLEDKIPADGMDDLLEYLDYQYGRISVDDGAQKPEFSDWYKEARKTNKVLRAAMKPSVAAGALEDSTEVKPEPKAAPKPVAKQNVVQPKPGETGREVVLSKVKMGTPEWNAAKDRLAKSAFTRG
jgi:deoxyribodipyrimidine photolyase